MENLSGTNNEKKRTPAVVPQNTSHPEEKAAYLKPALSRFPMIPKFIARAG
jgi:hypothetical protein